MMGSQKAIRKSAKLYTGMADRERVKVVEVGVFRGENAKHILSAWQVDVIYLVDPYVVHWISHLTGNETPGTVEEAMKNLKIAKSALTPHEGLHHLHKAIWIHKMSWEVDDYDIPDKGDIDYVYIDGDHSYWACKMDMEVYWKFLKPSNSMLAGHDFNFVGVARAFNEFVATHRSEIASSGNEGEGQPRSDWWIIKKEPTWK